MKLEHGNSSIKAIFCGGITMPKKCGHCGVIKDESCFSKDSSTITGLRCWCKDCVRPSRKKYHDLHREKAHFQNKLWNKDNLARKREIGRKYYTSEKGRETHNKNIRKYLERHPERHFCRSVVNHAIRDRKLFVQPCAVCGTTKKIQAHHEDYSKPLEVIWLCQKHHRDLHNEQRLAQQS